ncbi:MAG: hypothetical protein AMXMBFR33_33990 [Candidatus Xenobia bacterium]
MSMDRIKALELKLQQLDARMGGQKGYITQSGAPSHLVSGQTRSSEAVTFENLVNSLAQEKKPATAARPSSPSSGRWAGEPSDYDGMIKEASGKYNVDEALIRAVIKQESAYNPKAESHCGAMGLMQLMPETAAELGVTDGFDPYQNIMGGTKYLRQMLDTFQGNMTKAIAAYNAGPGAVMQSGGIPPYAETQHYVSVVLDNYQRYKQQSGGSSF